MNLHLPFSVFSSGKELGSNLREVNLVLMCKDKYPIHTVLCIKTVLGALAGVVLLKLYVECWI